MNHLRIRIFGWSLTAIRQKPLFSERNRITKPLRLGEWVISAKRFS